MEISSNKNLPVYKCKFVSCKVFYNKLSFLEHHVSSCLHTKDSNFWKIKCPIHNCNFIFENHEDENVVSRKRKKVHKDMSYYLEHLKTAHPHQYKAAFDILKSSLEITIPNSTSEKESLDFNHNSSELKHSIAFSDLISCKSELGKLLNTMQVAGCLLVRDNDWYKCKIWGCGKEYDNRLAYKAHISTHKHSITNFLNFVPKKIPFNLDLVLQELKFFDSVFLIEKIPQFLEMEKDYLNPIVFKNDVNPAKVTKKEKDSEDVVNPENIQNNDSLQPSPRSFIDIYDSIDEKTSVTPYVEKLYYKNTEYRDESAKIYPNFAYINIKECITCATIIKTPNPLIFVGTKQNFDPDIFGKFDSNSSKIYVLDFDFVVKDKLEFNFGHMRKIIIDEYETNSFFYMLFSDGIIRKMEYKDANYNPLALEGKNYIDFVILDSKTIIATDGQMIYKIIDGKVTDRSAYFDSYINSLCIRTKIRDNLTNLSINDLEEDDSSMKDIKMKTSRNLICCSTVNGHIYSVDIDFKNRLSLVKNFYTHKIFYMEKDDDILFTNQMYYTTKILNIEPTYAKTRGLFESLFYSVCRTKAGYIFGQNDGFLKYIKKANKKVNFEELFKFVKKGSSFFILDTLDEFDHIKNTNYDCLITEVCKVDKTIFVFLKCGVVFKFLLNK